MSDTKTNAQAHSEGKQIADTVCWADISVTDLGRAIKFYTALLGHEVKHIQEHGFEFGLLPHENNNVSGCLSTEGKPSQDGALIYFNVIGRMNDALEVAKNNGGKVLLEQTRMGEYGARAILLDCEGNRIALYDL